MADALQLREYLKRVTVDLAAARRRISELEERPGAPVSVSGMAGRFPGAAGGTEGLWDLLTAGGTGVRDLPTNRWTADSDELAGRGVYTGRGSFLTDDVGGFDASFFGLSAIEAMRMDPHQRMLLEMVWEGLESAGIAPPAVAGSRTGIFVGYMEQMQYGRVQAEALGPEIITDPRFGQGVSPSVIAGRLAYHFDLRGPTLALDTACSSSLVGVHLAMQSLRRGECDLAIVAGVHLLLHPDVFVQACVTGMLARDGRTKTFDVAADGYVLGEAGGLVVLERLDDAERAGRPIRAVLRGSAVGQDGRSNGLTAPNRSAQVDVIRRAQFDAGVVPAEIDLVEAHGSGTGLGDAIELAALHDVFAPRAGTPLAVGAAKSALGHTQAAAGIAGLVKTILVLEHGEIPANLHLREPSAALPADGSLRLVVEPQSLGHPDRPVLAGVSSFGWSGTNAHLVVQAAPALTATVDDGEHHLFAVSAAGSAALAAQLERLADHQQRHRPAPADVAHTLAAGRAPHDRRKSVVATASTAAEMLRHAAGTPSSAVPRRPRIAFLLPGIGDLQPGAVADVIRQEPVFATAVGRCTTILRKRWGIDLDPVLLGTTDGAADPFAAVAVGADPMDRAEIAHPYLFTVEHALLALLEYWGVVPDVLLGYSLGEYVAACRAGVFSLEDALTVVVGRAKAIAAAPPGRMLAVAAGEDVAAQVVAAVRAEHPEAVLDIAALNGPTMTVISGDPAAIAAVAGRCRRDGKAHQLLRSEHPFHSSLLEPAAATVRDLLAGITCREPTVTIVSNTTGVSLTPAEATDGEYWSRHLLRPVRFAAGAAHAVESEKVDVFVEIGPGRTLGGLIRTLSATEGVEALGTLPGRWADSTPRTELLTTCGRLWEWGAPVDLPRLTANGRLLPLPDYAFQRTRYWPTGSAAAAPDRPADHCFLPVWRPTTRVPCADTVGIGPILVVEDQDGVGAAIVAGARTAGLTADLLRSGDLLSAGPLTLVVPTFGELATAEDPLGGERELDRALRDGVDRLLLAVQQLGERGGAARVLTLTRGALPVLGGDVSSPLSAVAHGLARGIPHEYPDLTWRGVDLDPDTGADPVAGAVAELLALEPDSAPTVHARRAGRRWIPDWTEAPAAEPAAKSSWPVDGVQLITGGTRGLGLELARHLVASGARRIALVGRSAATEGDERATALGAAVAGLTENGAEIRLIVADIGTPTGMAMAIEDCRNHFGRIDVLVHAAGVPAAGMLQGLTPQRARSVLAPKLAPLAAISRLVGAETPVEQRPSLIVLYSSAITAFGGIGEADYCAANTALESWGRALADLAPTTRMRTVAWGPWLHDPWQGSAPGGGVLAARGAEYRTRYGFPAADGCRLLDRLVGADHPTVMALRQPLAAARRDFRAMLDITSLAGGLLAETDRRERFPRPPLRVTFRAPRSPNEKIVAEVWGRFLGIGDVGVHDPFFDLGGNSLIGTAMVLELQRVLKREIPPAALYQYPTVAEFAASLQTDPAAGVAAMQASSERGERRRRARRRA